MSECLRVCLCLCVCESQDSPTGVLLAVRDNACGFEVASSFRAEFGSGPTRIEDSQEEVLSRHSKRGGDLDDEGDRR